MMDRLTALFTESKFGSMELIIFAFFIGACLAGIATVYHRRTIGTLVRYLIDHEAFSAEQARSLRDAEQDLNIFVRYHLKRNAAFRRIICMVPATPADTQNGTSEKKDRSKKDSRSFSDIPLYINPKERQRAEEMYAAKTAEGANLWMVLLSILVFAVVAYLSTMVIPKLISFLNSFLDSLS